LSTGAQVKTIVRTVLTAMAAALIGASPATYSQSYPSKPIRMFSEFPAGSGGDLLGRIVASSMAELLGQPVLVENRAGGGGVVAAEAVIRSAPDGYTILEATPNALIVRRFLAKSISFDTLKDLTPITCIGPATIMIIVKPSLPVKTLKDLIDYGLANPGALSYGTSGFGTAHHLTGEQIKRLTGIDWVHVPYKGGMLATQDVMSGQIPMAIAIGGSTMPFVRSGKVRVLGVVAAKRSNVLPDIPVVAEVIPGFEVPPGWTGLFGPANLPQAVLRRLNTDAVKAMSTPEVRAKIADAGFDVVANSPEEFASQIRREIDLVDRTVKGAGLKPMD
jgi:tripartite-type tricarboxylate transporter receptor subunit TctC